MVHGVHSRNYHICRHISAPSSLKRTQAKGLIKYSSHLKTTRMSKILTFYGIITEIAPKYRRFSYAKNSELYMNQRWKIAITGILQKTTIATGGTSTRVN